MLIAMLLLQSVQPQTAPDIQLNAHVSARSLTIEKHGEARLTLRTEPDGGGNVVDVRAPSANGRKTIKNVDVTVRAEARIADPAQIRVEAETGQPAPR